MRIDGFVPATGTKSNSGADILNKLKPGDTIRAQVLENSESELTLKLSDGSKVSASAMNPVDAAEGDFVNFVFKGTIDGKPVLEVASRSVQPQGDEALEDIKNTLTTLKLPITEQNIELVNALKGQNVPVTADSMSKIIDLVSKNSELKPDSAAFLTAANMSNDKNNIEKLQNLLAGRLKISNDIGELLKLINGDDNNSVADVKSATVNNILEKLAIEITSKGVNQANNAVAVNKDGAALNAETKSSSSANTAALTNNKSTTIANSTNSTVNSSGTTSAASIPSASATSIASTNSAANANNANGSPNNASGSAANINVNGTTIISTASNNIIDNVETTDAANNSKVNNIANNSTNGTASTIANNLASSLIENAKNEATNTNNVALQISKLLKDGAPLGKADLPLLNSLNSQLESLVSTGNLSTEELSATKLIAKEINDVIFKSQGHETPKNLKIFEDAVNNLKNLFIKVDNNSDEINPVKLYRDMDFALQDLKNSILQLPTAMRETTMNIANNLESNLNFINQLNNYSSYVQIPLSIFNQNTTGELYMLKKGSKSRKLDPTNMTILISLDSNNIGRIDTLLSIDKKNISTNFRLEDSGVFNVLKENHKMLYNNLLEKGYKLVDFTYKLMDEPINIVNFEAEAKKEFIKSPNNIDIMI